ncbi:MAG: 50S ribosomal protein L4 [Proteobacteria bacterium]|nr:MAG: 50S ribosomal protein L4 [Pseudomonadota bacterium]
MVESEKITCKVVTQAGKPSGSLELDKRIFGAAIVASLVHDTVVWQLAKRRAGTHSTISKGVMRGGGRKPWRQKGTGRARAGSNTSPLWVGGAVAHGPKPHKYETRLSKRVRTQALSAVLSDKLSQEKLLVVDDLEIKSGKTKDALKILQALGVNPNSTALVVLADKERELTARAVRNLPGVLALPACGANVYDLLRFEYVVSTKAAIEDLQKRLGSELKDITK